MNVFLIFFYTKNEIIEIIMSNSNLSFSFAYLQKSKYFKWDTDHKVNSFKVSKRLFHCVLFFQKL